jgi:predicted nucleotidyltransferase
LVDVLRESLRPLADRIDVALVFGSFASGEQRAGSDVDILVIGRVSLLDVVTALGHPQEELRRELNPVVMSRKKFVAARSTRDRFLQRVLDGPKLYVIGDAASLEEPA